MGGLDIVFDWSFDGSAWPGPAVPSFGEVWLGPQGLLDRLELALGLSASQPTALERSLRLSRSLDTGFWSASLEVDPIATARRLLDDRDLLVSWGWRGERVSDRLASLWEATSKAMPGVPDRLLRVIEHAVHNRVDVSRITCLESVDSYPPIWRQMLRTLHQHGVRIEVRPVLSAPAAGDLFGARTSAFSPSGDTSLQMIRPHGVLAAADSIAAAIAAASEDESIVVIGPDAILDDALERCGAPRLGADRPATGSASLLRACIECAFHPVDTRDLHVLVCADPGPVPRNIAWALAGALRTLAGRGSRQWSEGLTKEIAALPPEARGPVAERVRALLEPLVLRHERVALDAIAQRLGRLEDWARGRGLDELAMRTCEFVRLLDGVKDASRDELLRLCDELESPTYAAGRGQAGLHSVIYPGAIVEPASTIIWWGFTRDRAPASPRVHLSRSERAALDAAAPDVGAIMAGEARRWRRPLELAAKTLVLICPRTDAVGDAAHPHPLWDELVAVMPDRALQSRLRRDMPVLGGVAVRRENVRPRALPIAFDGVTAPLPLSLRARESASSLTGLLGCSLAYVLQYGGGIRPRLAARPVEPGPLLYGNVAHYVLALTMGHGRLSPTDAATRAETVFDEQLGQIAEPLLLADHQAERTMLRRAIVEGARLLAGIIQATGATLRGVECDVTGAVGTAAVDGRADMVLENPRYVIDLKWGSSTHRDALKNGAAVQLAIYGKLLGGEAGAAYVSLRDQRVLAPRGSRLPFASEPGDYPLHEMTLAMMAALERRTAELADGRLVASGAFGGDDRSRVDDGVLHLAPECDRCQYGAFCGRRGRA